MRNMLLCEDGHVILGENLLSAPLKVIEKCERVDYEAYLGDEFWYLTREVYSIFLIYFTAAEGAPCRSCWEPTSR